MSLTFLGVPSSVIHTRSSPSSCRAVQHCGGSCLPQPSILPQQQSSEPQEFQTAISIKACRIWPTDLGAAFLLEILSRGVVCYHSWHVFVCTCMYEFSSLSKTVQGFQASHWCNQPCVLKSHCFPQNATHNGNGDASPITAPDFVRFLAQLLQIVWGYSPTSQLFSMKAFFKPQMGLIS